MKKIKKRKRSAADRKHEIQCYLLILPQLIGFLVFTIYPILWAVKWSWYYYNQIPSQTRFVGWQNFINVFTDETYWNTWLTTIKFTLIKLPLEIPLALFIAILLQRKIRGRGFYRAVYFMPTMVGVAIIGVIFSNMFNYLGLINGWLRELGFDPVDWFGKSQFSALLVLAVGSVWNTFGTNVLYFIAALSNVPEELYESASIDGAGKIATFFKVTLPMITPMFATVLLLAINGTLATNEYIMVLTGGAPRGTTYTVMAYITSNYAPGFAPGSVNIGYGCALSFTTSVIMCLFAAVYTKIKNKLENIY